MPIFVSVIIPTYYDWDRLGLCLRALENQSYGTDGFEIIIVNNAPSDSKPNGFQLPTNAKIITEEKPGSYAARNAAIKVGKGSVLAFTDSDCIPHEDWISNAVEEIRDGRERLAGHVELFYRSNRLGLVEIYEKEFAFDQKKYAERGTSVTANMITKAESFRKVGLFNDSLYSGGDLQWGLKAQSNGISIHYAENVIVKHPARHHLQAVIEKRKRVAGGEFKMGKINESYISLIIRGLLPPFRRLLRVAKSKRLSFHEKLLLMGLLYFLKLNTSMYKLLLKLGIRSPQRV